MRRLLQIIGLGLLAAVLLLVSLPWWLGPVLRAAAGHAGASFESYERHGYGRFSLHGVRVGRPGVDVWVESIEAPTPVVWAWRHFLGGEPEIKAGAWEVETGDVASAGAPSPGLVADEEPTPGWRPLHDQLSQVVDTLAVWLPRAEAGPGRIVVPGVTLTVGPATWRDRTLALSGLRVRRFAFDVEWRWPAGAEEWTLEVTSRDIDARGRLRGNGGRLEGEGELWGQAARGEARFDDHGWLPLEAGATAERWVLPGGRLGLGDHYASIGGDMRMTWADRRLAVTASAKGEPEAGQEVPPLTVDLKGASDLESFSVEALHVSMPGLNAELTAPVVIRPGDGLAGAASRFRFDGNLAELPWEGWAGVIRGEFDLTPTDARWPKIEAQVEAADVATADWKIDHASFAAELNWPVLNVTRFEGATAGDGRWQGEGGWDFEEKVVLPSRLGGSLSRNAVAEWLPDTVDFTLAEVALSAEGAWPGVRHTGTARVADVKSEPLKTLGVSFSWEGEGEAVSRLEATVAGPASELALRGSGRWGQATIEGLEWRGAEETRWSLAEPATMSWEDGLRVDGLRLAGPVSSLDFSLRLGSGGEASVRAEDFDSAWLADWVEVPGPAWRIRDFAFSGRWSDGPLLFDLTSLVTLALGDEREATIDVAATGGAEGVRLERLGASEGDTPILSATGQLPFSIRPAENPRWRIEEDRELALNATSEANPEFWTKIAELTGVRLDSPALSAEISGTWRQPRGTVTLAAERVVLNMRIGGRVLPELSGLSARMQADAGGLELGEFSLRVAGQELRARGRLPLAPSEWRSAWENPLETLERGADLRIEIPDADMAALARHVPEYLAPVGRLRVDLAVQPGTGWDGYLRLENAASRPLGPLGVLQEIGADVRFAGRGIEFRTVTARMGGQPVRLSGAVNWPRDERMPRLDLALKGENLPFVRQAGLLVRGDLDLHLRTLEDGRTRIGGITRLRDSLFLSDVRAFIPRGGRAASPTRRPPYFAVEVPPLNDWELNVEVAGDRFLRLRTPVFNGTASARFRLGGTLGDPRAIGEATINEGRVMLPFATFTLQQGAVRLTEADPYDAQLLVTGTSRRFGYDLRMELGGTASRPNLTFNSSPPLESEQVLLMVMAGEAPGDEVTYTGSQRAMRLGTYLGQSLIARLGGDPTRAERFSLTTGERVSRQGRETYGLSYELDSRWSLVGEYDEFDDYNVGVKWKLFSREESPAASGEGDENAP